MIRTSASVAHTLVAVELLALVFLPLLPQVSSYKPRSEIAVQHMASDESLTTTLSYQRSDDELSPKSSPMILSSESRVDHSGNRTGTLFSFPHFEQCTSIIGSTPTLSVFVT